jgi:hypothetical protein
MGKRARRARRADLPRTMDAAHLRPLCHTYPHGHSPSLAMAERGCARGRYGSMSRFNMTL